MKHCTVLPIKDQRLCMSEVSKVVIVAFTQQYIQSNLTHVRGVESSSKYLMAVMPMHVEGVERIYTHFYS